jgi:hypothetical protein
MRGKQRALISGRIRLARSNFKEAINLPSIRASIISSKVLRRRGYKEQAGRSIAQQYLVMVKSA